MDPLQFGFGLGLGLGTSMRGSQTGMSTGANSLNGLFGVAQADQSMMGNSFLTDANATTGMPNQDQDAMSMMYMASSQMMMSMMGMFQQLMGMYQQLMGPFGTMNVSQSGTLQNGSADFLSPASVSNTAASGSGGFDVSNAGSGFMGTGGMLGDSVAWAQQLLAEDKQRLANETAAEETSDSSSTDSTPIMTSPDSSRDGTTGLKGITPNQFELGDPDQGSMCGIVAGAAFAKAAGKDLSIAQIKQFAIDEGNWNASQGMGGSIGQVNMLNAMGIPAHEEGLDWDKAIQTVQSGKPVIITSPRHYFVMESYDPATGMVDLGNSAAILKRTGGRHEFTIEELMNGSVMDPGHTPDGAIYMD